VNKCRECRGELEIMGTDGMGLDSLIEVHCKDCDTTYYVEPDGLGMGGEELIYAMAIDEGISL